MRVGAQTLVAMRIERRTRERRGRSLCKVGAPKPDRHALRSCAFGRARAPCAWRRGAAAG
eukprot:596813-Pleurochrysis_carterae.AAC.1